MIIKPRFKSPELIYLNALHSRIKLPERIQQHYRFLEKGHNGEVLFDKWLEILSDEFVILSDLFFEHNLSYFQIDSIVFSKNMIYMFEVKNYEGDFYVKDEKWFSGKGKEIKNPLLQLKRCESLLRTFLLDNNINYQLVANLVFVNPEFMLYQAPMNTPIIFPSQIQRYLKEINNQPFTLYQDHSKTVEKLMSLHLLESPFSQLPHFEFKHLQKGIPCSSCNSFSISVGDNHCICSKCGLSEHIETAVMRCVEEYKILFPEERITRNIIFEWCNQTVPKRTITQILLKHLTPMGHGKYRYYI